MAIEIVDLIYPLKIVILHSYVSLPEGNCSKWLGWTYSTKIGLNDDDENWHKNWGLSKWWRENRTYYNLPKSNRCWKWVRWVKLLRLQVLDNRGVADGSNLHHWWLHIILHIWLYLNTWLTWLTWLDIWSPFWFSYHIPWLHPQSDGPAELLWLHRPFFSVEIPSSKRGTELGASELGKTLK